MPRGKEGGKKRRGKKEAGRNKRPAGAFEALSRPAPHRPPPSAPFFFGDCAARACGAPAPPLCCAEPDGRPPRARATAPKPSDFGAVSFTRAARADAPGAAGLACCIDPSPRHPPRRRRELLRCIIPRCFFFPDRLFLGSGQANQNARHFRGRRRRRTASPWPRAPRRKRKPDPIGKGKEKGRNRTKQQGKARSATSGNPGPKKRQRRTAEQPQAKKQKTTNARKRTRAFSRNKAVEGFSPLKCR